jgi:hypothetical protein
MGLRMLDPPLSPHPYQRIFFVSESRGMLKKIFCIFFSHFQEGISIFFFKCNPKFPQPPQIVVFCDLKTHTIFQNPTITPSGRNVVVGEREK